MYKNTKYTYIKKVKYILVALFCNTNNVIALKITFFTSNITRIKRRMYELVLTSLHRVTFE